MRMMMPLFFLVDGCINSVTIASPVLLFWKASSATLSPFVVMLKFKLSSSGETFLVLGDHK